jgi:hypothetical protein
MPLRSEFTAALVLSGVPRVSSFPAPSREAGRARGGGGGEEKRKATGRGTGPGRRQCPVPGQRAGLPAWADRAGVRFVSPRMVEGEVRVGRRERRQRRANGRWVVWLRVAIFPKEIGGGGGATGGRFRLLICGEVRFRARYVVPKKNSANHCRGEGFDA